MNQSPEAIEAQEELAFQRETQRAQAANALAHQRAEVDRVKAVAACWWLLSMFILVATLVGAVVAIKVAW
jgi:hypothetical protein